MTRTLIFASALLLVATPAGSQAGKKGKVDWCHWSKGAGYRVLSISAMGLRGHGSHALDHLAGAYYLDTDGDGLGDYDGTASDCMETEDFVDNDDDACPDEAADTSDGCPEADVPYFDLAGHYEIAFVCTWGCSGVYSHQLEVDFADLGTGEIAGEGYYIPDTSYTWDMEGEVLGSEVAWTITYTGSLAGYWVEVVGEIDADGTLFGTAVAAMGQEFDWSTTSGAATAL